MVKTSPERLAAALRANLKRRKAAPAQSTPAPGPQKPGKDPAKPVEKPQRELPPRG